MAALPCDARTVHAENILRKSDQKRQLDWLAIQSGGFNTEMLAKLNLGALQRLSWRAECARMRLNAACCSPAVLRLCGRCCWRL